MARETTKWPSTRWPITKIMSSDGCNGNRVPLEMGPWYDFREFGCHLGNVGLNSSRNPRANLESEISLAIAKTPNEFRRALIRIKDEVQEQSDAPFANIEYDKIFADATVTALNTKGLKEVILEYITRYDELLAASTFFKKGIFDYFTPRRSPTA